jgi:magnesium chelatase subunit D
VTPRPPAEGAEDGESGQAAADAALAAALFAIDPIGLGGVALRARSGPVRETWIADLRAALPEETPVRRVPINIADGRLLGGLDLPATLRAGRPIAARGVLAEADGGVLLLAMAERIETATAARIVAAMDAGEVVAAREGIEVRSPSRFGVVALDEGVNDDERTPPALLDRLAFHLDLAPVSTRDVVKPPSIPFAARISLSAIAVADDVIEALCGTAIAFGVASARAPLLALRAARAAAALAGRMEVTEEDAATAARLVLAPRATMLPFDESPADESPADQPPQDDQPPDVPPEQEVSSEQQQEPEPEDADAAPRELGEIVLDATRAAIPAGLLLRLQAEAARGRARAGGRAGAMRQTAKRGRPAGVRRGDPRDGARLSVIETLRAAAPWQALRRRENPPDAARPDRIEIRAEDFHVGRFKQRGETTTIFVVDASGSAALNRLAEAKGAVELLLAECYIRRDQVAVIAFRGRGAELLLPPTRSLVRAKRSLAGLPGGGGTPSVVLLTDGRANIARDGSPGRPVAEQQATEAARLFPLAGISALLVDTSPRPHPMAQRLAVAMRARYLPLPQANATSLSTAARALAAEGRRGG